MRDLILGHNAVWKRTYPLPAALRFQHLYTIGKTGVGKSTFFHRLIHQDARQPYATILFDAGDLATEVLEALPERCLERAMFFSVEHPIPYNPLLRRADDPDLAVRAARLENELCALIDQTTAEASTSMPLTPRMKRLLSAAIREALKEPAPTFSTIATLLTTKSGTLARNLGMRDADLALTLEAVNDRLGFFLRDPRIRRVICAPHELDFGRVIDQGKILLISLAGLDKALKRFLGTLLFYGLQATILERSDKTKRHPVAVYVDEFHDYIKSSYAVQNFQDIFSQGRKFKCALAVAHTDFGQMPTDLLRTIHSTAGSLVAFSCGAPEAQTMSRYFGMDWPAEMLAFLPARTAVARIENNVYRFETFPPPTRHREVLADTRPRLPDPPDPYDLTTRPNDHSTSQETPRKPRRAGHIPK